MGIELPGSTGSPKVTELIKKHGIDSVRHAFALQSGYASPMPTIDEFLDSDRYLGNSDIDVYPFWREKLREVFPTPYHSPYRVIVLTLAIGTGKSTFSIICMLYDLCRLLHLSNMHQYLGLSKTKPVSFALVNRTLTLSAAVLLDTMKSMIQQSSFFQEHTEKCINRKLLFNDIELVQASRASHILGRDVVAALLSELAFYDSTAQAAEAYHNAETRIDSRFLAAKARTGIWPGRLIVDTSPADDNSFVNETFLDKMYAADDCLVITGAYWDVHKDRMNYSGGTFRVFYGDKERDPAIISPDNEQEYVDTPNVIDVPIEHKKLFESDLVRNIADKAGIAAVGSSSFITSVETIVEGLCLPMETKNRYILSVTEKIPVVLPESIDKSWPLFIHLDLSLSGDVTGIAISHPSPDIEIDKFGIPHFTVDTPIAFGIKANGQIPLSGIKKWIIGISQTHNLQHVTADTYQSAMILQELLQVDINASICSVDITTEPYDLVKRLLIDHRIAICNNPILAAELRALLLVRTGKTKKWKVDHPSGTRPMSISPVIGVDGENHSKDIADAVAGSAYTCLAKAGESIIKQAQVDDRLNEMLGTKLVDVEPVDLDLFDDDVWN